MARPRKIENLFNKPKSNVQFSEGQKSKGILDDFAVRKNIDSSEGTVQHTPTLDKHIANKKYVDDLTDPSLLDNSMADALHRHSELSASDGTPDRIVYTNSDGVLFVDALGTGVSSGLGLDVMYAATIGTHLIVGNNITVNGTAGIGVAAGTGGSNLIVRGSGNECKIRLGQSAGGGRVQIFFLENEGNIRGSITADYAVDQLVYQVSASLGNQLILTLFPTTDHDHAVQTNPTFYVQSATNPNSSNDEWISFTHDQTDGLIKTGSGDLELGEKTKFTRIGGLAIQLTNKTGVDTVAGQLVQADTSANDAVKLTGIDEEECFGVFLDSGIAANAEAWVVISGIADIAMEDNTTATRGNWVRSSITEAGYADATNAAPLSLPVSSLTPFICIVVFIYVFISCLKLYERA